MKFRKLLKMYENLRSIESTRKNGFWFKTSQNLLFYPHKVWQFLQEIVRRFEESQKSGMVQTKIILLVCTTIVISKNAEKCGVGRKHRRWYNRERAFQSFSKIRCPEWEFQGSSADCQPEQRGHKAWFRLYRRRFSQAKTHSAVFFDIKIRWNELVKRSWMTFAMENNSTFS